MKFCSCGYYKQYQFTLKDLLEHSQVNESKLALFNKTDSVSKIAKKILNLSSLTGRIKTLTEDSKVNILFSEHIVQKKFNEIIFTIDSYDGKSATDEEVAEKYEEWFGFFMSLLSDTYDKFTTLIGNFESQKATLLARVKSKTTGTISGQTNTTAGIDSRENDTPQDEGVYTDLTHASKTSHSQSSNQVNNQGLNVIEAEDDKATPAERLAEVESKINNYYFQWAKVFDKLFMED